MRDISYQTGQNLLVLLYATLKREDYSIQDL